MTEYEAGRELDAELVRRVFGLPVKYDVPFGMGEPCTYSNLRDESEGWFYVPDFSTEMNAAWLLVERMGERLEGLYPSYDVEPVRLMHWVAVTTDGRWEPRRGHVADTAPLAVCRAALAATPPERRSSESGAVIVKLEKVAEGSES